MQAGVAGMLADLFARNASIRQCAVWGLPQARKRLAIGKPAGETVSKFVEHDRLRWRAKARAVLGWSKAQSIGAKLMHDRKDCAGFLASRGACHCRSKQDCPTPSMPAHLRVMPASRYSHGRKELFISAKWISTGTI
jgi:hypothetical protein